MALIRDHLLLEAQPAMTIPNMVKEVMAAIYNTPIFRSATLAPGPKGITTHTIKAAAKIITGAVMNRALSTAVGTMSSLTRSLIVSASVCAHP